MVGEGAGGAWCLRVRESRLVCISSLRGGGGGCRHVKVGDRVRSMPALDWPAISCCLRGSDRLNPRVQP